MRKRHCRRENWLWPAAHVTELHSAHLRTARACATSMNIVRSPFVANQDKPEPEGANLASGIGAPAMIVGPDLPHLHVNVCRCPHGSCHTATSSSPPPLDSSCPLSKLQYRVPSTITKPKRIGGCNTDRSYTVKAEKEVGQLHAMKAETSFQCICNVRDSKADVQGLRRAKNDPTFARMQVTACTGNPFVGSLAAKCEKRELFTFGPNPLDKQQGR